MGEVYQAHDTKLGRDVAIKVLPEAFAHDPERLARFQREAKLLASLNHPNIATIYGLEHSNGTNYLVMELVPGRDASGARQARWSGSDRRSSRHREADRRSSGSRARKRHHSPRSEARQREVDARRQSEGVGLRLGESIRRRHINGGHGQLADAEHGRDDAGSDSRHCGLHDTRASQGQSGRQAHGHLGVRLRALRAAHRQANFPRRRRHRHSGRRSQSGTGLEALPAKSLRRFVCCCSAACGKIKRQRIPDAAMSESRLRMRLRHRKIPVSTQAAPASTSKLLLAVASVAAALAVLLVVASWVAWRATRPGELKPLVRLDVDLGPDVSLGSPGGSRPDHFARRHAVGVCVARASLYPAARSAQRH